MKKALRWVAAVLLTGFALVACYSGIVLYRLGERSKTEVNLGAIRSKLSEFKDKKGRFPADLAELSVVGMEKLPASHAVTYHRATTAVRYGIEPDDSGGWLYDNAPGGRDFGTVRINCTHVDNVYYNNPGIPWTSY